jgi:signal transduction histidine kinase
MQDKSLIVLLGELTQKENRRSASRKIAKLIGATDLAFFVKDPEVDFFFPAQGYTQILKDASDWQSFLLKCSSVSPSSAMLPWPDSTVTKETRSLVTGISTYGKGENEENMDLILAVLGEPSASDNLDQLMGVLPILASCIRYEWLALSAQNSVNVQAYEVKKSEILLQQLDKTRLVLQNGLYLSQKALNARRDFLSVASHELKTPLQSIILEVGMLKRSFSKFKSSECEAKFLGRFESLDLHLKRMSTLVDNLLDYSQVAEGKMMFNYQRIDLCELAENVIRRFKRQASEAGCKFYFNAPERIMVHCDVSKMDQVICNLILNAIKYGPEKEIHVGVSLSGERPVVYVKDHGRGIPLDEQTKIFEKFERCHNSQNISGFGLGLFVVKQIVDGHGGSIEVQSEPQKGSTFKIFLPQNINQMELSHEQLH